MKKKKSKKKLFIILGIIILAIVLVALNLGQSERGVVSVQTKKVARADVVSVVSGSGTVQPKTQVNITSEVTAEVIGLAVKEGDYVNRGQVLIRLDTLQAQKDMESALYADNELEARLDGARVTLEQYRDEYERQSRLYDKKLTSEQVYKNAYYSYKSQEANYSALNEQKRAAFSRLEKARDNLSKTTITSPMDGTITLIDVEVGEIAQAQTAFTQGRTLMIISDLSEFEVEVEIDETDIADLDLNQKARIEIDAFPDTTFEGRVAEIGNTAITTGYGSSDQSTNFRVKVAVIETLHKIRPGMSSTVDITTSEHNDVLTVPIQAIVMREFDPDSLKKSEEKTEEDGNLAIASTISDSAEEASDEANEEKEKVEKKGVFVNRDGLARFVEVETGINDQQNYEVLAGLEEDDEVIVGSFRVLRTIADSTSIKVDNRRFGGENSQ